MNPTFREMYCARHGVDAAEFERRLFLDGLYPHARLILWLLHLAGPDYFAPDHEFIQAVGQLRSRRLLHGEISEFHSHPRNRGFCRIVLRLRVSTTRVRRLVDADWQGQDSHSPV